MRSPAASHRSQARLDPRNLPGSQRRRSIAYLQAVLRPCVLVTMLMSPGGAVLATPWNTGVSSTGAVLTAGSTDPHWTQVYATASTTAITASELALLTFGPAFANRNSNSWLANGPDSGWITPSQTPDTEETPGQYVYHTQFTGNTPFGGQYASDNELYEVFLNATLLPLFPVNNPNTGFFTWTTFDIAAGLIDGVNALDFVVRNRGIGGGPLVPTMSGFRVEFSAVPEIDPNGLSAVLGLIVGGLGLLERRRHGR
jgi:hypothetical protein